MWQWFNFSRHLVWGDYLNKGTNCPISHWCALCGTLNQFGYLGFEQVILGYAHWRYVIVFVCLFFTQSKEGVGICEPCKDIRNKRLEVVVEYKNSFDINADPFEMCVKIVQITYYEYAHRGTKERACLGKSKSIVWFGANSWSTMHFPMLEVVHTQIKYVQRQDVFICEFIDVVKST